MGSVACGHAICFVPPFSLSLLRLIFLDLSDSSGQVASRSLYFGWCENWAAVSYHLGGRPWSDITRVLDKQLTGRPPTKAGDRRTSSDEARSAAAPWRVGRDNGTKGGALRRCEGVRVRQSLPHLTHSVFIHPPCFSYLRSISLLPPAILYFFIFCSPPVPLSHPLPLALPPLTLSFRVVTTILPI